jgi:hypothetical protein
MNDPFGRQPETGSNARLTRRTATQALTVLLQRGTSRPVNRAIHTATAQQTLIGGIDNGVYRQTGNISVQHLDHS